MYSLLLYTYNFFNDGILCTTDATYLLLAAAPVPLVKLPEDHDE